MSNRNILEATLLLTIFILFAGTSSAGAEKLTPLLSTEQRGTLSFVVSGASAPVNDPVWEAQLFAERNQATLNVGDLGRNLAMSAVDTDSLGMTHVRYRQEIDGIPVLGAEMVVHLNAAGVVTAVTGSISSLGQAETAAALTADDAYQVARSDWIARSGDGKVALRSARLYLVDPALLDRNDAGSALELVWQIEIIGETLESSMTYHVDARAGTVIRAYSRIRDLNRVVFDCSFGDGFCRLDQFAFGYVFGRSEGQPDRGASPIYSTDQFDTDFIYYRIGASHNYFLAKFGRNGANFSGGIGVTPSTAQYTPAASYAGDGINHDQFAIGRCPNANWDPDRERLSFCKGMPTLDIVGHEFTHALTHFSVRDEFGAPRGFLFSNESGSLSEGFADVFGEAAERFAYGSNNWMMGSSQGVTTPIMRDLKNPESMNLPSTMYSPSYFCGTDDAGGIHTNNVVLAHAAYRLANGGELSGCRINGIGQDKQEAIFYRALSTYFSSTSGYAAAYTALINSCSDIFGSGSEECLQTKRTLNAVMMNQPGRCSGVPQSPVDCMDPTDLCPQNPNKREPGICGCTDEVDADTNGAFDCVAKDEFRADLNALTAQVAKLTKPPASRAKKAQQAAIKSEIKRIVSELEAIAFGAPSALTLKPGSQPLSTLFTAVKKSVTGAMKTGSKKFTANKSKARKSISKLAAGLI